MAEVVLFDYWRSSASYRVRLALALKNIPYRSVSVNLAAGVQSEPDHMARNPMGAVPVLDIDGLRLTQSLAIIEYLDETRGGLSLIPRDPKRKARARALALIIAADVHPLGNLATLNRIAELGGEVEKVKWAQYYISRGLAAFETKLREIPKAKFSTGDTPGLADVCLVPQLYNAVRWDVDLAAFPLCQEINAAFAELPAYREAHPDRFAPET